MQLTDLQAVPGVPESTLDAATLAQLPDSAPPAPWEVRCSAIVWFDRASRTALSALDPAVASLGRPVTVIGGMVRYDDTPVGTYDEVFGVVGLRRGMGVIGSVPFMAVNSHASLVGGRSNWSLPKSIAAFTGAPGSGSTFAASGVNATGAEWSVRASARAIGPSLPVRRAARLAQAWPDGVVRESTMHARGRMQLAMMHVEVSSSGPLGTWLRSGRRLGAIVSDSTFTLTESSFVSPR